MDEENLSKHPKKTEPEIIDYTPDLHHYTRWVGLKGMIKSNNLWATHYGHLNDYTEVEHMKARLAEHVSERIKPRLKEYVRGSLSRKRIVDGHGGLIAASKAIASDSVQRLYEVTYVGVKEPKIPMAQPYIFRSATIKVTTPTLGKMGYLASGEHMPHRKDTRLCSIREDFMNC
jgi:hypothetical protein